MSFRSRLTLFFVLIVIVPMISVAVVVFRLISDNETGKSDASVARSQTFAVGLYRQHIAEAGLIAKRIGRDPALAARLRADDDAGAEKRLRALAGQDASRVALIRAGRTVADVGLGDAVAPASLNLTDAAGGQIAQLRVSTTQATEYASELKRLGNVDVVLRGPDRVLAATLPAARTAKLPSLGHTSLDGTEYRVRSFKAQGFSDAPGSGSESLHVSILADAAATKAGVRDSRLLAAAILTGFLILAFAFAVLVSRSLQSQIERFLEAARRLGEGDFSSAVPTDGRDEFAALGEEFNKMSRQLSTSFDELRSERERLRQAMVRIGETFASNLDRDGLLEIVIRTALDGVPAEAGRALVRDILGEPLEQHASAGDLTGLTGAIEEAETQASGSGALAVVDHDGVAAMAYPLRSTEGGAVLGVLTIARRGRAFDPSESDLFAYLAGQAAVSMENVDLHELVQRQAVTDELTGLFNHRRFQEVMDLEVERARRFDQELGLVLLDIDNFKMVNDTYGHQQGDAVLREVSRVLRDSAREIDEPARYGGEELAVALPQTDLEGAGRVAERVREAIEALEIPRVDTHGFIKVTASLGVAAAPACAQSKEDLIAAADAALYEAKRSGKNRVVRAEAVASLPED